MIITNLDLYLILPLIQFKLARVGGKGEIRTPEELAPLPLFESGAFDHSATFPVCITLPFFEIFANF